ncbi:MAG: helix-turn-helix transcriptional regulator [Lachnospiraceae bacterium]|nr:helix-turn-helix transcriptional regulator [Lachnospiraceae bacterium]
MSPNRKNSLIIFIIIALSFTWSGAGYLASLYHIMDIVSPEKANIVMEVYDYLFQGLGLFGTIIYVRFKGTDHIRHLFASGSMAWIIVFFTSLYTNNSPSAIAMDSISAVLIGITTGIYLTLLATIKSNRGFLFGAGWALATVASWLISLAKDGVFLRSRLTVVPCAILVAFSIISVYVFYVDVEENGEKESFERKYHPVYAGVFILLAGIVFSLGYLFDSSPVATGAVDLELSRCFYAVGLMLAGIVYDRSKRTGLLLCVCALICPFASVLLTNYPGTTVALYIVNYVFRGFFTVYCVSTFVDYARVSGLFLAGAGLMFRRIGEPAGALLGIAFDDNPVAITVLTSIFFAATIIAAAFVQTNTYDLSASTDDDDKLASFRKKYVLSSREEEVLNEVLKGSTNPQIASTLFISENTVKFHIRNLLKKTETSNRKELIALFNDR